MGHCKTGFSIFPDPPSERDTHGQPMTRRGTIINQPPRERLPHRGITQYNIQPPATPAQEQDENSSPRNTRNNR